MYLNPKVKYFDWNHFTKSYFTFSSSSDPNAVASLNLFWHQALEGLCRFFLVISWLDDILVTYRDIFNFIDTNSRFPVNQSDLITKCFWIWVNFVLQSNSKARICISMAKWSTDRAVIMKNSQKWSKKFKLKHYNNFCILSLFMLMGNNVLL